MKTLLLLPLLFLMAIQSRAALYINNATYCVNQVVIYAFDPNNATCMLQSQVITLQPQTAIAFNNVTSLNVTPGWQGAVIAVTTGAWGWNGAVINGSPAWSVGGTGSCFTTSTLTMPTLCGDPMQATWMMVGTNTFLELTP